MFLWEFEFNPAFNQEVSLSVCAYIYIYVCLIYTNDSLTVILCAYVCTTSHSGSAPTQKLWNRRWAEWNRFPSLPFVTSNIPTGEYETAIIYTVYSEKCDVFRIRWGGDAEKLLRGGIFMFCCMRFVYLCPRGSYLCLCVRESEWVGG